MIVFLAADARRYTELDEAVRKYLAWKDIGDRIRELDLSTQQMTQAAKRLKDADETVDLRISAAYHWLLVPVQPMVDRPVSLDEIKTDTAKDRLAERASDKLRAADMLRIGAGAAEHPAGPGPVPVHRLVCRPHRGRQALGVLLPVRLPAPAGRTLRARPRNRSRSSIRWSGTRTASRSRLATTKQAGRYVGLAIPQENVPPQITDSTLLVRPDRAIAQREQERAEQEAARAAAAAAAAGAAGTGAVSGTGTDSGATASGAGGTAPGGGSFPGPASAPGGSAPYGGCAGADSRCRPKNTRFYGTVRLDPERFGRDLNRLYQEVIQHLAAPEGVDLEITVEISASKKDGYPDDKARIVTENARTLKFDQYGFEDH